MSEPQSAKAWWTERLASEGFRLGVPLESFPRWVPAFDATVAAFLALAVLAFLVGAIYLQNWLAVLPIPMLFLAAAAPSLRYFWLTQRQVVPTAEGLELRTRRSRRLVRWNDVLRVAGGPYWYTVEFREHGRVHVRRRPRLRGLRHPRLFEHQSPFVESRVRRKPPRA